MKILRVADKSLADMCDEMLTSIIMEERESDFVVNDWYSTTLEDEQRITYAAIDGEEAIRFIHGFVKDELKG